VRNAAGAALNDMGKANVEVLQTQPMENRLQRLAQTELSHASKYSLVFFSL
jgi:hypothetical protein